MQMSEEYDVYGAGAALVDREVNVTDDDLKKMGLEKSLMTLIDREKEKEIIDYFQEKLSNCKRTSGGSTGNSIIGIAQFGGKTFYSCRVANDENGEFYLDDLRRAGVHYHFEKKSSDDRTGTCLVLISPDAERTLCTYFGINDSLSEDDIQLEIILRSKYVYFESYMFMSPNSSAAAFRLSNLAKEKKIKIALSFSDPGVVKTYRDNLLKILIDGIDLLFCNLSEAFSWAQTDHLETAVDSLKKISRAFAITLGANGALVYDGKQLHTIPPYRVDSIDTSGAGDMFAGAFLYATTQGIDFERAGRLANYAAAILVSKHGPRLTRDEQQQILSQWNDSS